LNSTSREVEPSTSRGVEPKDILDLNIEDDSATSILDIVHNNNDKSRRYYE
ncbi:22195_t:CDS:2, partial [Cetraspora pellucida]